METKVVELLKLKIWVESKTKKVVFAEAGKEFVDFLFHIMRLPLATVVQLVSGKDMGGSLAALYESIESLETKYFVDNHNKDSILKPMTPVVVPLLSVDDLTTTITYYRCPKHDFTSNYQGTQCPECNRFMYEVKSDSKSSSTNNVATGFVKELVTYMVMDNLEVKPMSVTLLKSHVGDFTSLEEKEVEVGPQEGLAVLKASLETNSVLTTVFVRQQFKDIGAAAVKEGELAEESDDDLGFSLFD